MNLVGISSIGRINADQVLLMHLYLKGGKTNAKIHIGETFDNENVINLANLTPESEKRFCQSFLRTGDFIKLGEAIIVNIKKISAIIFEKIDKKNKEGKDLEYSFENYDNEGVNLIWAKIFFNNRVDNHFTIADLDSRGVRTIKKDIPKGKDLVPLGNVAIINRQHILTVMYNRNFEIIFGNSINSQNKLNFSNISKEEIIRFDKNIKN